MQRFIKNVLSGMTTGKAFQQAQLEYSNKFRLIPAYKRKTMASNVLYGAPSAQPVL